MNINSTLKREGIKIIDSLDALDINKIATTISTTMANTFPEYAGLSILANQLKSNQDLKFHFWRKYSSKTTVQINEPDLILEDENSVLIIECKYHSFLDETFSENKSEYTNQLLRYSTIINDYYSNKKNKNIIFLTLKDYDVKECLEKTRMKLPEKIGLYWLKWEELYPCLKEYEKCNISTGEKNLVNDILQFLSIRKLKYFSGINISKNNFSWKYKRNYKYKFASKFDSFTWRYNYE